MSKNPSYGKATFGTRCENYEDPLMVAKVIADQIGTDTFLALGLIPGAGQMDALPCECDPQRAAGLGFRVASYPATDFFEVWLAANDTYTVRARRRMGGRETYYAERDNIYFDELADVLLDEQAKLEAA